MSTSLNDILKLGLEMRKLIPSESIIKTSWERKIGGRDNWGGSWTSMAWICDVFDDYVEVKTGYIPTQDYPRFTTAKFYAADPKFFEKIWPALDKALKTLSD